MARRTWLVIGLGGLIFSAASRVTAAGPAQAEAEAYGGSVVGEWACGPTARANYGGVGGHVRLYTEDQPAKRPPEEVNAPNRPLEPDPEAQSAEGAALAAPAAELPPPPPAAERNDALPNLEPHGFSLGGGGGVEYRSFTRLECSDGCGPNDAVPPSRGLGAARANIGWDWDYFGVRVGTLVFQRWEDNNASAPDTNILPDVDFRFGRRAGLHGGLGFGAYSVSTIFRPGGYLALGYASGPWASELRTGLHATFDGQIGPRVDLASRYALSRVVAPGIGLAISSAERIGPEGRIFIVFTP